MQKLRPLVEERPWGRFEQFVKNEAVTVKILFIKKGETFSLQKHHERDEFWRVLSGEPTITIGDNTVTGKPGDDFEVPKDVEHRVQALTDNVEILEISSGEFSEEDIIRLDDKYGRT